MTSIFTITDNSALSAAEIVMFRSLSSDVADGDAEWDWARKLSDADLNCASLHVRRALRAEKERAVEAADAHRSLNAKERAASHREHRDSEMRAAAVACGVRW